MNKVILKGNLTKDPEMTTTSNGISVAKFTVAVHRRFTNANGEYEADFVNCVAWRTTAEFVHKYFKKGKQILLCGAIQTRSYDAQDGTKRYVTEVVVDEVEFCGTTDATKNGENENTDKPEAVQKFEPIDDDNLPF